MLAPAALFAALVLVGPILAHMIRRSPTEIRAYGAGLLLERLLKRVERRRQVHDRLLLLLRLLALLAIILAVARPELRLPETDASIGGSGRVVVVLDSSLSMDQRAGGESAFTQAQRAAALLIRSLAPGVKVAAFTAGAPAEAITAGWSEDHGLAATLVESARQSSSNTDLDGALTLARGLLAGEPGEVVVYTDGAGPGNVAACEHSIERLVASGSVILLRPVGVANPSNLVVSEAKYGDGLEGGQVAIRVLNFGSQPADVPATVRLPDGAQITAFVRVEAATEAGPGLGNTSVTVPRQAEGGVASVTLADTGLPLDDAHYFHLPRVGRSRVLVVDGDPGSTPTKSEVYFLERALAPFAGNGAVLDVVSGAGAARLAEGRWRVAVLANVGNPEGIGAVLADFVRGGGALVLAVGDNTSAEAWNRALPDLLPARLGRVRDLVSLDADQGVPLAVPGLDQSLFEAFTSGSRAAFSRVRARRIFSVESYAETPEVRTLLRFENGAPALIERVVGNGRVLLLTSTVDLGWGNFPLQSVYAPFWQRLLGWLGGELGGGAERLLGTVAQPVAVPLPAGAEFEVTAPDGTRTGASRIGNELRFVPELPGGFAVGRPAEPPAAWVAVNTPLVESDVRADLSLDEARSRIDAGRSRRLLPLDVPLVVGCAGLLAAAGLVAARRREDAG